MLSLRDIEEILAQRGIEVSYKTIRCWTRKFGPLIARRLKKPRLAPSPRWLDRRSAHLSVGAIDDAAKVLEVVVQRRRDDEAAATIRKNADWGRFASWRLT
ncbi:hypothetical protein [Brevundimonas sp.]|uniref:hypothetical protein n=1 Tax=Brevundimonas sp. TaxID=1871086 RepID=UPI001ACCB0DB|nr:hypothetical protein [Brevundimonas sp.]MBN9466976.1 IS6 family transposase [Brevundimonas sp.]